MMNTKNIPFEIYQNGLGQYAAKVELSGTHFFVNPFNIKKEIYFFGTREKLLETIDEVVNSEAFKKEYEKHLSPLKKFMSMKVTKHENNHSTGSTGSNVFVYFQAYPNLLLSNAVWT